MVAGRNFAFFLNNKGGIYCLVNWNQRTNKLVKAITGEYVQNELILEVSAGHRHEDIIYE